MKVRMHVYIGVDSIDGKSYEFAYNMNFDCNKIKFKAIPSSPTCSSKQHPFIFKNLVVWGLLIWLTRVKGGKKNVHTIHKKKRKEMQMVAPWEGLHNKLFNHRHSNVHMRNIHNAGRAMASKEK